jgi:hypothetical protein
MALNIKKVSNNNKARVEQKNIEPGTYPGRLVQIIDMGLQAQRAFQGKDKPPAQEVMLTYELVDEFMKDEKGIDIIDKPRWISETLPFYGLHADKAKSTQRYLALDPKQEFEGDFSRTIDTPVNVTIVNNISGEKVYDNIATISTMRPRDAQSCPELVNNPKVFDLDNPDMEVFNALPEWIQTKIKGNLKYEGSTLQKLASGTKEESPKTPEPEIQDDEGQPAKDDNAPY